MRGDVVLDLLAGDAGGIECVAGFVARAREERLVAFEQIVAAAVDEEIVVDLLLDGARAIRERLIDSQAFGITLPPERALEILSGLDELADHSHFASRQACRRE